MGTVATNLFSFCSSRRRHTRFDCDRSSDVCSSDLMATGPQAGHVEGDIRDPLDLDLSLPGPVDVRLLPWRKAQLPRRASIDVVGPRAGVEGEPQGAGPVHLHPEKNPVPGHLDWDHGPAFGGIEGEQTSPASPNRRDLLEGTSGTPSPILSPTPPLRLRLYTAIVIESWGGFHRPRRRAGHGLGRPRAPGDHTARAHDLRPDLGPDPRTLRRGQGHPDRQRLRLRVPPDDPPRGPRGHV